MGRVSIRPCRVSERSAGVTVRAGTWHGSSRPLAVGPRSDSCEDVDQVAGLQHLAGLCVRPLGVGEPSLRGRECGLGPLELILQPGLLLLLIA